VLVCTSVWVLYELHAYVCVFSSIFTAIHHSLTNKGYYKYIMSGIVLDSRRRRRPRIRRRVNDVEEWIWLNIRTSDRVKETSLKAKAKDSTRKAKAKTMQGLKNCPRGSSRTRICPRGLQHWLEQQEKVQATYINEGNCIVDRVANPYHEDGTWHDITGLFFSLARDDNLIFRFTQQSV